VTAIRHRDRFSDRLVLHGLRLEDVQSKWLGNDLVRAEHIRFVVLIARNGVHHGVSAVRSGIRHALKSSGSE
jgi:hypothetical protein